MDPELSIVLVNWNTKKKLAACLSSLRRYSPVEGWEMIVVDNASSDGSVEMVQQDFPDVKLMVSPENEGFARGNNRGLREARGEHLLLLNSDTEVSSRSLQSLLVHLRKHQDVDVVGGRLVLPGGATQRSASTHITLHWIRCEQLMLDKLFARTRQYGGHFYLPKDYLKPFQVDVLSGACLLFRRSVLERVGSLDERFFMYCEDADWCRRVALAGGKLMYVPGPAIKHHLGGSSTSVRGDLVAAYNWSKCYYLSKYEGRAAAFRARLLCLEGALLRLGLHSMRALIKRQKLSDSPAVALWRDVFAKTSTIDPNMLPEPAQLLSPSGAPVGPMA